MTELDHHVATLLRVGTADLDTDLAWDHDAVARGGLVRGRARRRRRQVGTSLAGLGVSAGPGDDTRRAIDPPVADTPPDPASPAPQVGARELALRADRLPETFASLLPGDVSVPAAKQGDEPHGRLRPSTGLRHDHLRLDRARRRDRRPAGVGRRARPDHGRPDRAVVRRHGDAALCRRW